MRKLILAAAVTMAAIIPANAQQASFDAEQQKAIVWLMKNRDAVKTDMAQADRTAGRTLRIDEHIIRWFPFDPTTETFDRLRMQRAGEVIR